MAVTGDRSSGLSRTRQPPDGPGHSYCPTMFMQRLRIPQQKGPTYGRREFGIVCIWDRPEDTALGDWDMSGWYFDIPHEHAAWYVHTLGVGTSWSATTPTATVPPPSRDTVADGGRLMYLPDHRRGRGEPAPTLWKR